MNKLKALGLALVAMLALSAVAASAAVANYDSEAKTTELSGTALNNQVFETEFGEVVCTGASFTGTQTGTEKEAGVFTAETITAHPAYTGCKALGFNATVNTEGCNYVFNPATTTEGTYDAHAKVDIECDPGKAIHIVAAGGLCSVDVPAQTNVGLVDFENTGTGSTRDVDVSSTANEIEYEGVGGFCSGEGEELGVYKGDVTVKGFSGGNQVGIWVT